MYYSQSTFLTMGQQPRVSGQVLYSGVVLHGSALSHGVSSYCDRRELTSRSTAVLPQNAFSLSQSTYVGALADSYRNESINDLRYYLCVLPEGMSNSINTGIQGHRTSIAIRLTGLLNEGKTSSHLCRTVITGKVTRLAKKTPALPPERGNHELPISQLRFASSCS